MKASFTKFKDRIWFVLNGGMRRLAKAPDRVQDVGFGLVAGIMKTAYLLPGNPLPGASAAFGALIGQPSPRRVYRGFVRQFILGQRRMEMLRVGRTDEIDRMLRIPDDPRLDALVKAGKGVVLVMPHCHASMVMVRALAARYPVLALVRATANETRAAIQLEYYANLGCDVLDVRRNSDAAVARAVLKALTKGKIVTGVVDAIREAPDEAQPVDKGRDAVRATAFGRPVGAVGWPARFAARAGAPILPVMVEQSPDAMTLRSADPIEATDIVTTTQGWVSALERLILQYPYDWLFVYDKHWVGVLQGKPVRMGSRRGSHPESAAS